MRPLRQSLEGPRPRHLPLRSVLQYIDPVENPPWSCGKALTERMVMKAFREQRFEDGPQGREEEPEHIAQTIARCIQDGWSEPVDIAIEQAKEGEECDFRVEVLDGKCRLYAAVVLGHEFVFSRVFADTELEARVFWAGGADSFEDQELIQLDGGTVWVHALDGSCVGRFDVELGMDVDVTVVAQLPAYEHLLQGGASVYDPKEEWVIFRTLMQRHYGVVVPPDMVRPSPVMRMRPGT